jgi:hypothetical protein
MARTSVIAVAGILGTQDGAGRAGNYDGTTDLAPFIDTASSVVDDLAAAYRDASLSLSTSKAELIERWLAAHYYTQLDPLYASRATAGGSGSFRDQSYLSVAKNLDPSGLLAGILETQVASGGWLGKLDGEKFTYDERN